MSLALAAVAVIVLVAFFISRGKKNKSDASPDLSPEIETWIAATLENELAVKVLGVRAPSEQEKKPLAETLSGVSPDPGVVEKIEAQVHAVEIDYVRYAHETDAQITLRVRYEDGSSSNVAKRILWDDVPESVRADFERRASTHVFRTWPFPWQRIRIA